VFIAALVGLCWFDLRAPWPGMYLWPLAVVVSLLTASELLAMFRKSGHRPLAWVVYMGTLVTVLAAGMPAFWIAGVASQTIGPLGWLALGLAAGLLLSMVGEIGRYTAPGQVTMNLALSSFAILYAGGLMGFIVQMRLIGGGPWGMLALVSLIATVKMSDIGQYTVGRLVGKHKLAPRISPGKTWEGVGGGMLFAAVAAWLVFGWGGELIVGVAGGGATIGGSRLASVLVFAVVVAAAGIVGDLAASLLKRDAGVKDSSDWMPGFGGVVDLLDSLLVAAPVVYAFWTLGLV
jgi:phosphatidate cytidylyltransferase